MVSERESDICIIGAGIGGLSAGVLLSKQGYKVKIFEKESLIGGRALSFDPSSMTLDNYKNLLSRFHMNVPFSEPSLETIFQRKMLNGYHLDLGYHLIGGGIISNLKNILSTSDKHFDVLESKLYVQKKDRTCLFVTTGDKIKMVPNLLRLFLSGESTMKRLDDISIADTIQQYGRGKTKLVLEVNPRLITTVNNLDLISAGRVFRTQRDQRLKGVRYPKNGLSSISQILADFIKRHGGEIILKTPVTKVIIDDNIATGVIAGGKEYFFKNIISNILVQHLFTIADEKHFPKDYVKNIRSLKGTGSLCAYYSLKKVDQNVLGKSFIFIERDVGVDGNDAVGMVDLMAALPESGLSPSSHYLVQSYIICTPREAKDKKTLEKLKRLLDKNLEKIIPDFRSYLNWAIYPAVWHLDGVAKTIDNIEPSIRSPVEGLFMVGDCVKAPGIGINCALNSARMLRDILLSTT